MSDDKPVSEPASDAQELSAAAQMLKAKTYASMVGVLGVGLFGMAAMMLGVMGFGLGKDKNMCMKKDCKGYGGSNMMRHMAIRLCEKHEAAIERVPEVRALVSRIYVVTMSANAHVMVGRDKDATEAANSLVKLEDQLYAAALAWSETPDEEPKPAPVEQPQPTEP